jgi:hypothetical protein
MLNQGLDPQGLRYAAAGGQYQHAQQNFQALGRFFMLHVHLQPHAASRQATGHTKVHLLLLSCLG